MKNLVCDNCGKTITRRMGKRNYHVFCSKECEKKFKHNQFYMNKECPICGNVFETRKNDQRTYCSLRCQIEWQKQNPRTGKNHPCYDHTINHTLVCEWCGNQYEASAYDVKRGRKFCSIKCKREWYAKVWSQNEEWKEDRRKWAVSLLENKVISKTMSSPQIIVNSMLENNKIDYVNEKTYNNCAVDNYLLDYNLIIEVMGTYFHCDFRKFDHILYTGQVNRIKMDKIKQSYIKNNYAISILYLWEDDIINNYNLCESLILEYINNCGVLKNYHSFNYLLENNNLMLKKDICIPYMERSVEETNSLISLKIKEKLSKKQTDKWIIYHCEICGKEKEELICHYNKSKHHYCSYECARIGKKKCHLLTN